MADWTEQDPDSLLAGKPWTASKALAAFENPVAIAEGADGAPKIVQKMRASTTMGMTTFTDLDDYGGIEFIFSMFSSNFTVTLEYSTDNGSTWSAAPSLGSFQSDRNPPSSTSSSGTGYFDFATGKLVCIYHMGGITSYFINTTVSGASLAINAIRINAACIIKLNGGVLT